MSSRPYITAVVAILTSLTASVSSRARHWIDLSGGVCPVQRHLTNEGNPLGQEVGWEGRSTGLLVEFYTTSPTISVRAETEDTAPCIFDLYATDCHGVVRRCEEVRRGDRETLFRVPASKSTHRFGDRIRLYLPPGIRLSGLMIGLEEGSSFFGLPDRLEYPVLACLDEEPEGHPSETRAALLERTLDLPVVFLPSDLPVEELCQVEAKLILLEGSDAEKRAERLRTMVSCPVVAQSHFEDLATVVRETLSLPQLEVYPPCTQSRDCAFYVWEERHNEVIRRNRLVDPEVLVIGNSIMHYWSGSPSSQLHRGDDSWSRLFAGRRVTNMGFGWDRIENLNWRLTHGELEGCRPEVILLAIGTNNLSAGDPHDQIARGVVETAQLLRRLCPESKICILGLLPRRDKEQQVAEVNELIRHHLSPLSGFSFIDLSDALTINGRIDERLFGDGLHPNAEGYRRLADRLAPHLRR